VTLFVDLMYVVAATVTLLCVLSILDAVYLPRVPLKSASELPEESPLVSVIVPARNEEDNIGTCLESLMRQDYPNYEIVVVDDRSTDSTADIVRRLAATDPRIRLVKGERLAGEWLGKSHALHQGVQVARGSWYLFVDADTWHHPRSISSCLLHCLAKKVDMLSLYPHFVCASFWEKVIQPAVGRIILFAAPLLLVNSSARVWRIFYMAIGQFILIRKGVYEGVGGHAAVRSLVAEDVELAKRVKKAGYRLHFLYGIDLLHTHMYHCFSEIWRGWSRSFYPGMGNNIVIAVIDTSLLFIFGTLPYLTLPIAALLVAIGVDTPALRTVYTLSLYLWGIIFATTFFVRWRLNEYPSYFFTCPLGGIMVQWIALHSLYAYTCDRKVLWKGRNLVS